MGCVPCRSRIRAPREQSPDTNGLLVRLIGRNRIRDGTLYIAASIALLPLTLCSLLRARCARSSWWDTLFDLYSVGDRPAAQRSTVAVEEQEAIDGAGTAGRRAAVTLVVISDTHMQHEKLEPLPAGDILLHTGDFTNFGSIEEVRRFAAWMGRQSGFQHKLVVPGNHDMVLDGQYYRDYYSDWAEEYCAAEEAVTALEQLGGCTVLVDRSVQLCGLNFLGSPWVERSTPWSTGFNRSSEEMQQHWDALGRTAAASGRIVDVLLTHNPPLGTGDMLSTGQRCGCPHLAKMVAEVLRPRMHFFGHVHSEPGVWRKGGTLYCNASSVSDLYAVGRRTALKFAIAPREEDRGVVPASKADCDSNATCRRRWQWGRNLAPTVAKDRSAA